MPVCPCYGTHAGEIPTQNRQRQTAGRARGRAAAHSVMGGIQTPSLVKFYRSDATAGACRALRRTAGSSDFRLPHMPSGEPGFVRGSGCRDCRHRTDHDWRHSRGHVGTWDMGHTHASTHTAATCVNHQASDTHTHTCVEVPPPA